MRKTILLFAAAIAFVSSSPALTQAWIGQVVGQLMTTPRPPTDACYNGLHLPKPKAVAIVIPYADRAIHDYERLALTQASLTPIFAKNGRWSLDGVETDVRVAKDPWVGPYTRLVPVSYVRSNFGGSVLVRWNAAANDGLMLGTYDALMVAKARSFALQEVKLYSASNRLKPEALKPYCQIPGDMEKWQEAKAKRDADKAAKRAQAETNRTIGLR